MRLFATFAVLLFSIQATLCGLRGFGIVELLHAQQAETPVHLLASAEPARDSVPDHCAGRADGSAPLEPSQAPGEAPCRSHCQLYAQGIPSDAPDTLSVPVPVAVHCAAAQCELGIHPARALHLLTGFRAPPLARDLPILHATLLI